MLAFSFAGFARTAALTLACGFAVATATAQVNPKVAAFSSDPSAEKISVKLQELNRDVKARRANFRTAPQARLVQQSADSSRILVDVIVKSAADAVVKSIAAAGVKVEGVYPEYNRVTVSVGDLQALYAVAKIPEVVLVKPVLKPLTSSSGAVDSRADRALASVVAFQSGVTGLGQKVGILSDSFAWTTGTRNAGTKPSVGLAGELVGANQQLTGDLPSNVALVRDDRPGADEGAGMAELVHDVAPGAAIAFHTALGGQAAFAAGIKRLRTETKATLLVDDVIYLDEPMYQDGIIAQEAGAAVSAGVPYFSAAGNFGNVALKQTYKDIDPTASNEAKLPPGSNDLHDWGGGNPFLPIFIPAGSSISMIMQWNQPYASVNPSKGAQIDMDVYLVSAPTAAALAAPLASSIDAQGVTSLPLGDPVESITYSGGTSQTVFLVVNHHAGRYTLPQSSRTPIEFRCVFFGAVDGRTGLKLDIQGLQDLTSAYGASTMFGHSQGAGVVSVAAVPWWEAPPFDPVNFGPTALIDPELFSSRGGNYMVPFSKYGTYSSYGRKGFTPTLAAVDGCNTTFFGQDDSAIEEQVTGTFYDGEPDGRPNFFGTSAAAPNAVAVASMMRQVKPSLKPSQITTNLQNTAIDVTGYRAAPGTDDVTGRGLISATNAVNLARSGVNLAPVFPAGSDDFIVVSDVTGTPADTIPVPENVPLYVDFSIRNIGTQNTSTNFNTQLLVDGVVVATFPQAGLAVGAQQTILDYQIGPLTPGIHKVKIFTDSGKKVYEANETDNTYEKTLVVGIPRPANDAFAARIILPQCPGSVTGTNVNASKQFGEPAHAGNPGGHSVWFQWTSPITGPVTLDTIGSNFDTLLAVYTGNTLPSLVEVSSNDDIVLGVDLQSRVQFNATEGGVYQIAVDGKDLAQGNYILNFTVPTNDPIAFAQAIGLSSGTLTVNTVCATKEAGEPAHAGNAGGASVWYAWTSPQTGVVTFTTLGSNFDTLLAAYTGTAFPLVLQAANDNDGASTTSLITFPVTAGTTYLLAIDGHNGARGKAQLNWLILSADDFVNRELIPGCGGSLVSSNVGATKQPGEPDHAGNPGGASVWYRWTCPITGEISIDTVGSTFDTLLAVYTGNSIATLVPVASNNDILNPTNLQSRVVFNATAGTEYVIAVDGSFGATGAFTLNFNVPVNDPLALAKVIAGTTGTVSVDTTCATKEPGEPNHAGNVGGASVWYDWTAPTTGVVTFDTAGSGFDTLLAAYTGAAYPLTLVAQNDNDFLFSLVTSRIVFNVTAGTSYKIAVDGKNGARGLARLNWQVNPPNDFFATPVDVTTCNGTAVGDNITATKEVGEPVHAGLGAGKSVWYRYTAVTTGPVTINTVGSTFDTVLAVYFFTNPAQTQFNQLTLLATNDNIPGGPGGMVTSQLTFFALAGVQYYIAVDGRAGATPDSGGVMLNWFCGVPVPNDFVSAPIGLSPECLGSITGNNGPATKEPGEADHAGFAGKKSLWYTFTPSALRTLRMNLKNSSPDLFDTILAVYTQGGSGLVPYAFNDEDPGVDSQLTFVVFPGVTYYIVVDGKVPFGPPAVADSGPFTLDWICLDSQPPVNDNFASRIVLAPCPAKVINASNQNGTKEVGEPNHAGNPGGASVWYEWTPAASGSVTIDTIGSNFDTLLAVYTGVAVNALNPVASNNDILNPTNLQSRVTFNAVAGTSYKIAVDGANGVVGLFNLTFTVPSNDPLEFAEVITGTTGTLVVDTTCATKETSEPNHAGNPGGASVWYSWTAPASGSYAFSTAGSSFDTLLALYTGTGYPLTLESANDNDGALPTSRVALTTVTAGTTYLIAVDGKNGAKGPAVLSWNAGPSNDLFAAALPVTSCNGTTVSNNANATSEIGEPVHAGLGAGKTVWFRYTAVTTGPVTVNTAGSAFDTVLAVYFFSNPAATQFNQLTLLATNDNIPGGPAAMLTSQVTFFALGGVDYYFAVDGRSGAIPDSGPVVINWCCAIPEANDFRSAPVAMTPECLGLVSGKNCTATKEPGEPDHAGFTGKKSLWYTYTPTAIRTLRLRVSNASPDLFDTLLAVYNLNGANLVPYAFNDEDPGPDSQLTFVVFPGVTYYVAVDGKVPYAPPAVADSGQFNLEWQCLDSTAPANDSFAARTVLAACPVPVINASNQNATKEFGEPSHAGNAGGASVWYEWTPAASGSVTIDTIGSNFDTLLAVYTGAAVNALTPVASNNDILNPTDLQSRVTFSAVAGTSYKIAVDGAGGAQGLYNLTFTVPSNDPLAFAQVITGTTGTLVVDTTCATKETSEPNHAGNPGGASVWYEWTAPASGSFVFSTAGSSFDTLLAVYTGTGYPLTPVASNDNDGALPTSRVALPAVTAGTTYTIALDGKNGAKGPAVLSWSLGPENDSFANALPVTSCNGTTASDSFNATSEVGEPVHAGLGAGKTVWFRYTAVTTGPVTVNTAGSGFDTVLAVYFFASPSGTQFNQLSLLATNDNIPGGPASMLTSQVTFFALGGVDYYFAVDGRSGSIPDSGPVVVNWCCAIPEANDFRAAPILMTPECLGLISGQNCTATKEPGEPDHAGFTGKKSLWYSYTPTAIRTLRVKVRNTSPDLFDTLLAVYNVSGSNLLPYAFNDEDPGPDSQLTFVVFPGVTYYVAVDGKVPFALPAVADSGPFTLEWQCVGGGAAPANDQFANRLALPSCPAGVVDSTNVNATKEAGEPNHAGDAGGASVWYSWTASVSGSVTVDTLGSNFDTLLAVYTGAAVNSLTPVAQNDDIVPVTNVRSRVTFNATAGTAYLIAVDGKGGATGNFRLTFTVPSNDPLAFAAVIGGTTGSLTVDTTCATKETTEPNHAGNAGGASVWYDWTAPASGSFVFSTAGSGFDTLLAVYTGSGYPLTPVVANDDDGPLPTSRVSLTTATAGQSYKIAVDGKNGAKGLALLTWNGGPTNDAFTSATTLSGCSGTTVSDSATATAEAGEPVHAGVGAGKSVWFAWTAPFEGPVTFNTVGSAFDTVMAVYTFPGPDPVNLAFNQLTLLATNDEIPLGPAGMTTSQVSFYAFAGEVYFIAVDGKASASPNAGTILLTWDTGLPPSNDFVSLPTLIADIGTTGTTTTLAGDSGRATKEPGEPDHAGIAGKKSVWYSYTPTTVQTIRLIVRNESATSDTACGPTTFNTLLAVYTGTGGTLIPYAFNDEDPTPESQVTFVVFPGNTYRIAVDGRSPAAPPPPGVDSDGGKFLLDILRLE